MIPEVYVLLKTQDIAFRSDDKAALCTARTHLPQAIREAKHNYAQRIYGHFLNKKGHTAYVARY